MNKNFVFNYVAGFVIILFSSSSIKAMGSGDNALLFLPKSITKKVFLTDAQFRAGQRPHVPQEETALVFKLLSRANINKEKAKRAGIQSLLERLLRENPDILRMTTPDGKSLLHIAAHKNFFNLAQFLVQNGAEINAVDRHKQTPFNYADQNAHHRIRTLLIQHGAQTLTTSASNKKEDSNYKQEMKQQKNNRKKKAQNIKQARSDKRIARDFQD